MYNKSEHLRMTEKYLLELDYEKYACKTIRVCLFCFRNT